MVRLWCIHASVVPPVLPAEKAWPRKSDALAILDALARYALQRTSLLDRGGARPHARSWHSANEDHMDSLADRLVRNLRGKNNLSVIPLCLYVALPGPTQRRIVADRRVAELSCFRWHHFLRIADRLAIGVHMNKSVGRPIGLEFCLVS